MSEPLHPLLALAVGERFRPTSVLQTCRLEGLGGETYGRHEIGEIADQLVLDSPELFAAEHFAIVTGQFDGEPAALAADLYDGRVGRLWRLGAGAPRLQSDVTPIATPFDPDLAQGRAGLGFEPSAHPDLTEEDAANLAALLSDPTVVPASPHLTIVGRRLFVLRASSLGSGFGGIALIVIVGHGADQPRFPLRFTTAVRWGGGAPWILSLARTAREARDWAPRI